MPLYCFVFYFVVKKSKIIKWFKYELLKSLWLKIHS